MAANRGFTQFNMDYNGRTSQEQARLILDEVRRQHEAGAAKVGITYSANAEQSAAIRNTYGAGGWQTNTNGANQAAVMAEVERLLATPAYADLQNVFQILPITTMHAGQGNVPNSVADNLVNADLDNVTNFAQNQGVVLGWQNNNTAPNNYAIGGGVSQALTADQNARIQATLQGLNQNNPAPQPAAAIPPPGAAPAPAGAAPAPAGAAPAPAGADEAARRAREAARIRALEDEAREYKADWERNNLLTKNRWKQFPNPDGAELDNAAAVMEAGERAPTPMFASGYYKTKGAEFKGLSMIHFDKDKMQVEMVKRAFHTPNYKDHANGRDFLQSQGVSRIKYDYKSTDVIGNSQARDTIKYLLDSIYAPGWEASFDKNGNLKPGVAAPPPFKEPPAAIRLGPHLKEFINNNIGNIDNKVIGKQKALLCQKMLELEALSQARLQARPPRADAAAVPPPAPAAAAVPPPPPPGGGGHAADPVVAAVDPAAPPPPAPAGDRFSGGGQTAEIEDVDLALPAQDNQVVEERGDLVNVAAHLSEAMQNMADNVDAGATADQEAGAGLSQLLEDHPFNKTEADPDALFELNEDVARDMQDIAKEIDGNDAFTPTEKSAIKDLLLDAVKDCKENGEIQPETRQKMNALQAEFAKDPDKANQFADINEKFNEKASAIKPASPSPH